MCLAIPGKVIEIDKNKFLIKYPGETRVVNISLIDVKKGDYVIVSNKMIISKVNTDKAEKFLEVVINNDS